MRLRALTAASLGVVHRDNAIAEARNFVDGRPNGYEPAVRAWIDWADREGRDLVRNHRVLASLAACCSSASVLAVGAAAPLTTVLFTATVIEAAVARHFGRLYRAIVACKRERTA